MTLVVQCITKDYALQVSDRRLTYLGGPSAGKVMGDESNKAVVLDNHMTWAYTGVTPIEGESPALWLARAFVEARQRDPGIDPLGLLHAVAEAATRAFARWRRRYAHAFLGVGWLKVSDHGGPWVLTPIMGWISNAMDENGAWTSRVQDTFTLRLEGYQLNRRIPVEAMSVGAAVTREEMRAAYRALQRIAQHGAGPTAAARVLTEHVRSVAMRDRTVGRSLMVNCIPRAAVEAGMSVLGGTSHGSPNLLEPTFQYVSDQTTHAYGPEVVIGTTVFGAAEIFSSEGGIDATTGRFNFSPGSQVSIRFGLPPRPPQRG